MEYFQYIVIYGLSVAVEVGKVSRRHSIAILNGLTDVKNKGGLELDFWDVIHCIIDKPFP